MKFLRRNEKSIERGDRSHEAELLYLKAMTLMEELEETRRLAKEAERKRVSERKQLLDPKRLLCFNNKAKKFLDYYDESNVKKSDWRSKSLDEIKSDRRISFDDEQRDAGEISESCNELCRDYYEIRKKLKHKPIALTRKRAEILDVIPKSTSDFSSTDAPLRKFDSSGKRKGKQHLHYSNENRELHRRQRSLLDDGSVSGEKNESKTNVPISNKVNNHRSYSMYRSSSNKQKSKKSKGSSNSKNSKSKDRQSNSSSSRRRWDVPPEISMSESTETDYSIPVSVVESRISSSIQPDLSMISTMSSASYTTCDESTVILSPRGAKDMVGMPPDVSRQRAFQCSSTPFFNGQPNVLRRNPSGSVGKALSNLGTITEDIDFSSSSESSAASSSSSSYNSVSSDSYSKSCVIHGRGQDGEDYDPSLATSFLSEDDDPSLEYERLMKQRLREIKVKKMNSNPISGCAITGGGIWNTFMFDDATNSIMENEIFGDDESRDDYY